MNNSLILLVVIINALLVQSWRPFSFRFEQIECKKMSELLVYTNCSLQVHNKLQSGLSFELKFATEVVSPELDLLITLKRNQQELIITNLTHINGCDFLQKKGIFKMLSIIQAELERFGTLPQQCPVASNTAVFIRNLTVRADQFPPYLPEGKFVVSVRLLEKSILGFALRIAGSVINKSRNLLI